MLTTSRLAVTAALLAIALFLISACERTDPQVVDRPAADVEIDDTVSIAERMQDPAADPDAVIDTIPPDRTAPDDVRLLHERAATPGDDWPSLIGLTPEEVKAEHGEPRVRLEVVAHDPAHSRMAWVYFPYEEDPTGYYVLFRADRVEETRLDEFSGVRSEPLLSWFER